MATTNTIRAMRKFLLREFTRPRFDPGQGSDAQVLNLLLAHPTWHSAGVTGGGRCRRASQGGRRKHSRRESIRTGRGGVKPATGAGDGGFAVSEAALWRLRGGGHPPVLHEPLTSQSP